MNSKNFIGIVSALGFFFACAVHRHASDPLPIPPAIVYEGAPVNVPVRSTYVTPSPPPANLLPLPAVKGLPSLIISTTIVSPAQLIGADMPFSEEYRRLPAFPEKIVMDVSWGLLSVGVATLAVDKIVKFNGRPAYHLVSEAHSNLFCDTFYSVRDLNESWIDAKTLSSLGYSKKLREGHFFRDEWVLYDQSAGRFVMRRTNRDGSFSVRVGTIPVHVQDILSSVYYTRAQTLAQGGEVIVDVNTPDNWPLVVKVGRREELKVPAGRFKSVLIEPAMRREGLFIQKGKRLQLWLSDDNLHRPLMLKVEVFFGHVTAVLREML